GLIVLVIWLCSGALVVAGEPTRHTPAAVRQSAVVSRSTVTQSAHGYKRSPTGRLAADRDPYADPASPYMAHRLSGSRSEPMLNTPGQTTVLTRQVLDDMNATTLRDAMRSTAGVTVGR